MSDARKPSEIWFFNNGQETGHYRLKDSHFNSLDDESYFTRGNPQQAAIVGPVDAQVSFFDDQQSRADENVLQIVLKRDASEANPVLVQAHLQTAEKTIPFELRLSRYASLDGAATRLDGLRLAQARLEVGRDALEQRPQRLEVLARLAVGNLLGRPLVGAGADMTQNGDVVVVRGSGQLGCQLVQVLRS